MPVTGIGGVFLVSRDPEKLKEWYQKVLGVDAGQYGHTFHWKDDNQGKGCTVWSVFKEGDEYLSPSDQSIMLNFRVSELDRLLADLEREGVKLVGGVDEYEYGRFAWILDPEGRKIELWEPVDGVF